MKFSHLDEQTLILEYVKQLRLQNKFCVDIGASDGAGMSNTYALFLEGWNGLAVEYESQKFSSLAHRYRRFSGVNLAKCKVTPVNVCALLEANQVPKKFDFLSLDIDGYDYYVLQKILNQFRPSLICTEINEKIPPPIKFTVSWYPEYVWGGDHFYGQSISQLYDLCTQCQYSLVELHYNNAFLIPEEINIYPSLTPEEAYTNGYIRQPDRKEKYPWNADVEELLNLSPQEAVIFINKFFRKYEGKFVCYLEEFGGYRQIKANQQYPLRKENHRLKSRITISQEPDELLGQDEAKEQMELVMAVGEAAIKLGNFELADREFRRVIQKHPNLAAAHAALGGVLLALDRADEAIAPLRRAIELVPEVAANHNQLGIALFRAGQPQEAEVAFNRAREFEPDDVEPLLNLIDLYRSQQRYQEAVEATKTALALDEDNPDVLVAFGILCYELGDNEGAQMAWAQLQSAPADHPGVKALGQLLDETQAAA